MDWNDWDFQYILYHQNSGLSRPWHPGWRRSTYERVIPTIWPLMLEGLAPVDEDGCYWAKEVWPRLESKVHEFAVTLSSADQELIMEAIGFPFREEIGPIGPRCKCRWCTSALDRQRREAQTPREQRLRDAFSGWLQWHLEFVLNDRYLYDRQLGAPRLISRFSTHHHPKEQVA